VGLFFEFAVVAKVACFFIVFSVFMHILVHAFYRAPCTKNQYSAFQLLSKIALRIAFIAR